MIQNNNIKEKSCDFYYKDKYLFTISDVVNFNDCRKQIADEGIYGYKIKFENEFIEIDKNGTLKEEPIGLFDANLETLCRLF